TAALELLRLTLCPLTSGVAGGGHRGGGCRGRRTGAGGGPGCPGRTGGRGGQLAAAVLALQGAAAPGGEEHPGGRQSSDGHHLRQLQSILPGNPCGVETAQLTDDGRARGRWWHLG